jgi:hypothetical protein
LLVYVAPLERVELEREQARILARELDRMFDEGLGVVKPGSLPLDKAALRGVPERRQAVVAQFEIGDSGGGTARPQSSCPAMAPTTSPDRPGSVAVRRNERLLTCRRVRV